MGEPDCTAEPDCVLQTDDHSVTTIAHNGTGEPTAIIGPYGQETKLAVDAQGYLQAITNPENEQTQYARSSSRSVSNSS
jgi:YD repeat-containing protein